MTYVVTESCIKCKYTDCVDVCPVDCFREGPNMLVIDPDECIDCTLCVPECPVEAIFAEDDVPDSQKEFIALNRERAQVWKPIIERKSPPPDADQWAKVKTRKNFWKSRTDKTQCSKCCAVILRVAKFLSPYATTEILKCYRVRIFFALKHFCKLDRVTFTLLGRRLHGTGKLAFTAVYLKATHGYIGFIEELPGVNSHGRTIEEARATLQKLAAVVFDEERRGAEEMIAGKDVVRESFFVAIPRT